MPLYVYAVILDDGSEGETFELLQGLHEPPLTQHPETGQPVRRVLAAPHTPPKGGKPAPDLSNRNLERLGFTRYEKSSKGYKKTAGEGPSSLRPQG